MERPLTSQELDVIYYIEQIWHEESLFPESSLLSAKFSKFSLAFAIENVTFQKALTNRGIPIPSTPESESLTNEQLSTILSLVNFDDSRPRHLKLKELGITATKLAGWMKNPQFKEYFDKLSASNFQNSFHTAQDSIIKAMDRGDMTAVKYYMELTGRHSQTSQTVQDLRVLLGQVIETISYHVRDQEVIRNISNDFNQILSGNQIIRPLRIEAGIE